MRGSNAWRNRSANTPLGINSVLIWPISPWMPGSARRDAISTTSLGSQQVAAHRPPLRLVRSSCEDGAVLVETAIASLLLLLLIFAMLDYGLLLRQVSNVADAVRAGGRAASWSSNGADADYNILSAMKATPTQPSDHITRVSIYKADGMGQPIAPTCKGFVVVPGLCSVYGTADFAASRTAVIARSTAQNGWSPTTRIPGSDYVGIRVETEHHFIFGMFGVSQPLHDAAVVRIEAAPATPSGSSTPPGFSDGPVFPGPPGTLVSKECTTCGTGSGGGGSSG